VVDHWEKSTKLTAMMRTTAWPASIVLQMLVSGVIGKRGAVLQELDVPFEPFAMEMAKRGIQIRFSQHSGTAELRAAFWGQDLPKAAKKGGA
jgi:saccharopine dehydrogenase-like NADP-dependent oxidoreductase